MDFLVHDALLLGECPRWDEANDRLLLVDILQGLVLSSPVGEECTAVRFSGTVGCVAPLKAPGNRVIAGCDDAIVFLDLDTGSVDVLARPESSRRDRVRMNDGGCDPQGRFVVGSMARDGIGAVGRLFRYSARGEVEVLLDGCGVSNGMLWDGSGQTMYHVDSGRKTIMAYDYTRAPLAQGTAVYRHVGVGTPDGMCWAADETLFVAIWDEGRVLRMRRDGTVLQEFAVPMKRPTACWFTGPNLSRLAVTSARDGLAAARSHDGRTALIDVGVAGVAAGRFGG